MLTLTTYLVVVSAGVILGTTFMLYMRSLSNKARIRRQLESMTLPHTEMDCWGDE